MQALAYFGKLAIHPTSVTNVAEFFDRAAIGPLPGGVVVLAGVVFHGMWVITALATLRIEQRYRTGRKLISIA